MYLLPGTPDDNNRDYLPERIKGSDIVVNENGNNSQPYPDRLLEFHGMTVDNEEDEWYEYVPESYDPTKKTPLVVSLHGGLMTGWGQAIYTSWTMASDRDGFIVLFPNAHRARAWELQWGAWNYDPKNPGSEDGRKLPQGIPISPDNLEENRDIRMILHLIKHMKEKYNIDDGRIFMQGMSMGNMMTALFARNYGNILAGAAGSACSTFLSLIYDEKGKVKNKGGHVAIWQSRPELNDIPSGKEESLRVNKYNRSYWMKINECGPIPQIKIMGEDNFAFYSGKKADMVYLDIKNRDHGQTLDDACLIWDYLYSGIRREPDGSIVNAEPVKPRKGDDYAISVAAGEKNGWFKNRLIPISGEAIKWQKLKYHGLNGGIKIRGEYICVPLSFLAEVFEAALHYGKDKLTAELILKDGRKVRFARGSIGCIVDQSVHSMYCEALHRNKELYISIEWFSRYLMGLHVSCCNDVVYAADHYNELSENMADLLKDLLSGEESKMLQE